MARNNPKSISLQNPQLVENLKFLTDPATYYLRVKRNITNPLHISLSLVNMHEPSILLCTASTNEDRELLSEVFDAIKKAAKDLLEQEQFTKNQFTRKTACFREAVNGLHRAKQVLLEKHRDGESASTYRKWFEGTNTLDGIFSTIAEDTLRNISSIIRSGTPRK